MTAEFTTKDQAQMAAMAALLEANATTDQVENVVGAIAAYTPETKVFDLEDGEYRTGRGPQGNLRNFKQMKDEKFYGVLADITAEDNDPEAMEAILAEADRRAS